MSDEVKLLPCPFCGGHGGIFQDDGDFYVCCTGCWSQSPLKEHEAEAIAAWNTRAIEATRPTDTDFGANRATREPSLK